MRKKITILLVLAGILGAVLLAKAFTASDTVQHEYNGTVKICAAIASDKALVLYRDSKQANKMEAPVNEDTLCIYNIADKSKEFVFADTDIYGNVNDQIIISDEKILYNNGAKVWQFTKKSGKWQAEEISAGKLKVLAPAGDKFLLREDDGAVIKNANDEILAKADIGYVRVAKWRADGEELAMITDDGSAVSLWNSNEKEIKKLAVGQELPDVRNWVEINGLNYSGDGQYLLISFLCESGNCLVLWDNEAEKTVDEKYFSYDLTVLNIYADKTLYTLDEGKDMHILGVYDLKSHELRELRQDSMSYTAGCFIDAERILINQFSGDTEQNILTIINLTE